MTDDDPHANPSPRMPVMRLVRIGPRLALWMWGLDLLGELQQRRRPLRRWIWTSWSRV